MKYVVEITEKLVKHVVVEADSPREAEEEAQQAHQFGKVTLDYDDYDDVEFNCVRKADYEDIDSYEHINNN